jgi:hypothetical protein
MAEIVSRQAALLASSTAGYKMRAADAGKVQWFVVTSPAVAAWGDGDTCGGRVRIPKGSRPLSGGLSSNAALGASVVMDVGLRAYKPDGTGAAIDADGIAVGIDVAAAGVDSLNNGAFLASGAETVTTEDAELYFTLRAANPTDNAQVRVEVPFLVPG